MRKYLMAGAATAALMFGLSQAVAQSTMGGHEKSGAATSAPSTSGGSMDHSKAQGSKTVGQARDDSGMKSDQKMGAGATQRDESKTTGQARDDMKNDKSAQSPSSNKMGSQRDESKSKSTTGQSRDEMKNEKGAQNPSSSSTKMGQQPSSTTEKNAQGSSSTTTGSSSSSATQLTTEQRTEVREKVLVNAPRENDVKFSVNVGTVVPRTVHVAEVPEMLIRIHPDWRGHRFFVVRDEIIIVDSDFRIIAVLPV